MIEHDLKFYLKKYFGYSSFKEGQEEVIKALIDQKMQLPFYLLELVNQCVIN
ncbi:hypothetical protein V8V50_06840 [Ligilactobacillus salivarius]